MRRCSIPGEGWHVAGGFFPGSPFMLHGHNAHLGWANTVNAPNVSTVYRLDVNPANPDQYRLDGQWKSFEKGDAAIRVKDLRTADLDSAPPAVVVGPRSGAQDRSRDVRGALRRHGRGAPTAAVLSP